MNVKPIFTVAVALLVMACSQQPLRISPAAEITADGLARVDNAVLDKTYIRQGLNLQNYNAIRLEFLGIDYKVVRDSAAYEWYPPPFRNEYNLTPAQKARFEALVTEVFIEEFVANKLFALTDESGSYVLLVKIGLADVVSFVPPERPARDAVFLFESGQATLLLEVDDSLSGQSFVRGSELIRVEPNQPNLFMLRESNPVTNWQQVKRVIRLWARQLVGELEGLHQQGEVL